MSARGTNRRVNEMIQKLIDKNIDRSFAVCDLNDIVRKWEMWKLAMPKIQPFYAVKCNNFPAILQLLSDLGVGFDCATKNEIEAILKTKYPANNIIFASTIKEVSHMSYADSVGVTLTTFDSLCELEKCKKYYPRAKLLIRIKTYSNNTSNFEGKFGCDPYNEAPVLLKFAKSLGVNVIGVAFHVGTTCSNGATYWTAIKLARYVFDVASSLGFGFNTLDIGGGFVGITDSSIFELGKVINNALGIYFPKEIINIMAEPGRYFVRSAVTLATKVICVKPMQLNYDENEAGYLYYVNNGVFGMFQTVLHGFPASSPIAWNKVFTRAPAYIGTVFGQTMAPCDIISSKVKLPKLDVGDWIVYENMGAYAQCFESEFHMYDKTPVYIISTIRNKIGQGLIEDQNDYGQL